MALLSAAELFERLDKRVLQDLASDTNAEIASGSIATDVNLLECMLDAEAEFISEVVVNGRYTYAGLVSIAGGSQTPAQNMMYSVMARLTEMKIFDRRPNIRPDPLPKRYADAL